MATQENAIAARDKIKWEKDCWNDVNRLIEDGDFESAIAMAAIYLEQNRLRARGFS